MNSFFLGRSGGLFTPSPPPRGAGCGLFVAIPNALSNCIIIYLQFILNLLQTWDTVNINPFTNVNDLNLSK